MPVGAAPDTSETEPNGSALAQSPVAAHDLPHIVRS